MSKLTSPIIVTGINHTGTTLVVEALIKLGVFMGDEGVDFISNNEWTPYLRTNNSILEEINPLGWRTAEFPPMEEMLEQKERIPIPTKNIPENWGFKVPSICVLLPLYLEHFPDAKIVYCTRNKEDNIASLLTRDGLTRDHWDKFVNTMDERFKQACSVYEKEYYEIDYDKFCNKPVKEIKKLCKYLGIKYEDISKWAKDFVKKPNKK